MRDQIFLKGLSLPRFLPRSVALLILCTCLSCSVTAVRPQQEMSNMEVSLKAAKEVNADILAPELYRTAQETSLRARREYRYKNFEAAKKYANQARAMAEQAEFEALRNGAKREAVPVDPLSEPSYAPVPVNNPNGNASATSSPSSSGSKNGTTPKSSTTTPTLPVPGFPKQ